jgi:TRAP-type C4-dicarboxylate transport system permease small subunit
VGLARLEDGLLALLTGAMLFLAVLQIGLRNLFAAPLSWIDPLVRHLVLWTALLGGLVATRMDRHVRFDALVRPLPARARTLCQLASHLAATVVCLLLAIAATRFVAAERAAGTRAFLGLAAWQVQVILPVAFGGMACRFLGQAVAGCRARHRDEEE